MELQAILERVDELKAEIDALRPINPVQEQRIMQKFRLEWNYHSNAIEGNSLTLGETRTLLLYGLTAKGKPLKDHLDIEGHDAAIKYLESFVRGQRPLTEASIREIHKILLVEPYEMDARTLDGRPTKRKITPGQYKTQPNNVITSTGEIFFFASPEETPALMGDLMAWYRREMEQGELHPLIIAATFHYRFVRIHPFDDGNGRMARLLMNLILMKAGYVPVVIRIESKESDYFPALEKADAEGDLSDFIELIGRELVKSLEVYLRGAKGESIDEFDDLDKKITLLKQRIQAEQETERESLARIAARQKKALNNLLVPLVERVSSSLSKFEKLFRHLHVKVFVDRSSNKVTGAVGKLKDFFLNSFVLSGVEKSIFIDYIFDGFIKNRDERLLLRLKIVFGENNIDIAYLLGVSSLPSPDSSRNRWKELIASQYQDTYDLEMIDRAVFEMVSDVYELVEGRVNE